MPLSATAKIFTVSELTQSIKTSLELQYRFVHIRGEISNLRIPYSGHAYFTLKDSGAQIRAVLFKGQQKYLHRKLEEGLSVVCNGRISVYEPRGEYQVIVDTVDFSGTGDLQLAFERLKQQLADEGLFDTDKKAVIPQFPEKIAVITSPTGAAIRDFLKIASMRHYWGSIDILPVSVQGKTASTEIAEAIDTACNSTNADIVVLIRGGGSLEDLWAFNEEKTARAIYRATLPVVTGIGHQTDLTIADLCADFSAHTPTAAAESLIADNAALQEVFLGFKERIVEKVSRRIEENSEKVRTLRRFMGDLGLFLDNYHLKLDYMTSSLVHAVQNMLFSKQARLDHTVERLDGQSPMGRILLRQHRLSSLSDNLRRNFDLVLQEKHNQLARQAAVLDSVSPLAVLSRGYSIITKEDEGDQKVISRTEQVEKGDCLNVRLHRGALRCEVKEKSEEGAQGFRDA